jgi:hypothetical protein
MDFGAGWRFHLGDPVDMPGVSGAASSMIYEP